MSKKIFVESINDQKFVQAVSNNIGLTIDDHFFYPKSIDKAGNNLKDFIKTQLEEVQNGNIDKIGIIIDLDDFQVSERLSYVSDAIKRAFKEELNQEIKLNFTSENQIQSVDIQGNTVGFVCYFMKVDNRGHLDTVLKTIANKPSGYADCLATWQTCVEDKKLTYDQNQYEKFWVNTYINLDTCSKNDSKQKERKCSMKALEYVMTKNIFDLEHECLSDLKIFLKMIN